MRLFDNPLAHRGPYSQEEARIVSIEASSRALNEVSSWPRYAPTPLRRLDRLARELGVGSVLYKDESGRLGQGSFKTLGGAYAATERLRELRGAATTLCCATDGNHGRSVAFAARQHGRPCVVFMHEHASAAKAAAIERLGATVVRTPGTYDDSVRCARVTAEKEGWLLVPDTSEDPQDPTTRRVMQGYGVMVLELLDQLQPAERPTHVFLQSGVGGLAAGVLGPLSEALGAARPTAVIVEPEAAACLYASAIQGGPARIDGDLRTAMEMLSTGEASPVAWPIISRRADTFLAIADEAALAARDRLVEDGLDVGVSGAAGLAGLAELLKSPPDAARLNLGARAVVLLFGTEGAE